MGLIEKPKVVIEFPNCRWQMWHELYQETIFFDGLKVPAAPVHERDLPTARRYGYGEDTAELARHHDLFHSIIAQALGWPYSKTLRYVATMGQEDVSEAFRAAEEWVTLQMQAYVANIGPAPCIPLSIATPHQARRLLDQRTEWWEQLANYGLL